MSSGSLNLSRRHSCVPDPDWMHCGAYFTANDRPSAVRLVLILA